MSKNTQSPTARVKKVGFWTIRVLPAGGYTASHGFAISEPIFACSTITELMNYIRNEAR
jgi:hypothetical protein